MPVSERAGVSVCQGDGVVDNSSVLREGLPSFPRVRPNVLLDQDTGTEVVSGYVD
jgi:hypothetical protein